MTGVELKRYRQSARSTQQAAAAALGVSQTYLSLLETGQRPVTEHLEAKAVAKFRLRPVKLPAAAEHYQVINVSDDRAAAELSSLGHPGSAHVRRSRKRNPTDVLLSVLNSPKRDTRLVEALPWLILEFTDMNWDSLMRTAKVHDLQNRLGFLTEVASCLATSTGDVSKVQLLSKYTADLRRSKLQREDTLCNETMTAAERTWLSRHRPSTARQWNLLTDMSPQNLNTYAVK